MKESLWYAILYTQWNVKSEIREAHSGRTVWKNLM